jgi:hypothetical protein
MKLLEEVTFDSLSAVRHELDEWIGSTAASVQTTDGRPRSRDLLVSILIHLLAEELHDTHVRSRVHDALAELSRKKRD